MLASSNAAKYLIFRGDVLLYMIKDVCSGYGSLCC